MPSDERLAQILDAHLERASDESAKEWLAACCERYGAGSTTEAVRALTRDELTPLLRLTQDIYKIQWERQVAWVVLPSPSFAASAMKVGDQHAIVVHEGLLTLLRLWATKTVLLDAAGRIGLPEEEWLQLGRTIMTCAEGLSLAFLTEPIRFARWDWRMSWDDRFRAAQLYVAMLAFVLAHEISHHRLGHTRSQLDVGTGHGPHGAHLLLDEHLHFLKTQEFAADRAAMSCAMAERTSFHAAACMFLDDLAALQSITGNTAKSHPFAANRLAELKKGFGREADPRLQRFERSAELWAQAYVESEKFGRTRVVDACRIKVPEGHAFLDRLTADIYGPRYKMDLIRELLRDQCEDLRWKRDRERCAAFLDTLDDDQALGSAMSSIVSITEDFLQMRYFGVPREEAFARIEAARAEHHGAARRGASTLEEFVAARLDVEARGCVTPERLGKAVDRTRRHFAF